MADTAFAESSRKALVEILGAERRDRILSALYLARQDAVNVVRQSAGHIWKALVHNTPRTGKAHPKFLVNVPLTFSISPRNIASTHQPGRYLACQ